MRWAVLAMMLAVLVLGVPGRGVAQQLSGPETLENLLQGKKDVPIASTEEAASDDDEPQPIRPAGTYARPKDSSKDPDLDKAWLEYDTSVEQASRLLRDAIGAQRAAAREAGDLEKAKQYKAMLEAFIQKGALPAGDRMLQKQVKAVEAAYKSAASELQKAYKSVVSKLVKDSTLDELVAQAVQEEWESLSARQPVQSVDVKQPTKSDGYGRPSVPNKSSAMAFNGHRYRCIPTKASWEQARKMCEDMKGHLVVIETAEENDFLTHMIESLKVQDRFWIGASRQGRDWVWVNGDRVRYTKWLPGEPSDTPGSNWITIAWFDGNSGVWMDTAARHGQFPFICEWDK